MKLSLDGREFDVQVEEGAVVVDGQRFPVALKGSGLTRTVTVGGKTMRVDLGEPAEDGARAANVDGRVWDVRASGGAAAMAARPAGEARTGGEAREGGGAPAQRAARPASRGAVAAQMTGRILRIEVQPGDEVQ